MREWLVTNGLGGYASLTYNNTNTRKFHGLLVTSLNPPTERWVFVSNVYDKIRIDDKIFILTDFKPKFVFDYFPTFYYDIEGVKIKKTYLMEHGKNTALVKYEVKTDKPITVSHSPILNSRHFYDVNGQRYLNFQQTVKDHCVEIKPDNTSKTIRLIMQDCFYKQAFYWDTFYYQKDNERNDSWIDNNVHIGDFYKTISKPFDYYLTLTLEDNYNISPSKVYLKEKQRKKTLIKQSNLPQKFEKMILSADNFIVKKGEGKSIIAGYHWFGDWGRDTLIALPGLTLVTKRFDDAKMILQSFSKYCKNGLIPNAFMDRDSKAVYNTVDASLWYIDRVYQYMKYTNDQEFLEQIWETLDSIINSYKNGTDFGIHMDDDYLINHGPGLTWMDVKIGDYYPTPRNNKAVEIQALWYNALMIMSFFSDYLGKKNTYSDTAENLKHYFCEQYNQLYDVIDTKDLSLRPNMIFLSSLDFDMVDKSIQKKIVQNIQENLLTVFGLRTLSRDNQMYKGSLFGNYNKDEAYHNGTVWPWLLGSFIKAYVKLDNSKKNREYAFKQFIKPMLNVFGDSWDGSIYEIFDGNPIYIPRGCVSQAWSVAEILRAWVEDIENQKPEIKKKLILHEISV